MEIVSLPYDVQLGERDGLLGELVLSPVSKAVVGDRARQGFGPVV